MDKTKIVAEGITFDDVLLIPAKSELVPSQAQTRSRLTNNIEINIPILSAAMDTVTEAALAIALAQEGGVGIIHKNLSVEAQKIEVAKVKRSEHGVILDPVTLSPDEPVRRAQELMSAVFEPGPANWRGIGTVPQSGLKLTKEYESFDAELSFNIDPGPTLEPRGCICSVILRGIKTPLDCTLFRSACTLEHPVGPCMVSPEGCCAGYYHYEII